MAAGTDPKDLVLTTHKSEKGDGQTLAAFMFHTTRFLTVYLLIFSHILLLVPRYCICALFNNSLELHEYFGSDATLGGLKFQFATRIKGDVQALKDSKSAGIDCKFAVLSCSQG